jgi:hypothetical protein
MTNPATRPLLALEKGVLLLLLALVIAFGVVVEVRSAFLSRRMGDLGCYLRPAWGVLVGEDIYDLKDDNGWHYNYPPLYAILLIPLADPPPGHDTTGFVPYAVSVALIYVLNMACLAVAVHVLASALERRAADRAYRDQPRFCRRWWALRFWPVVICLAPIGHTAMRGQVNLQILALVSAWIACHLNGRRLWAGFLLAVAICIKVIPVYLLVYPLWRRDRRALTGSVVGLFAGLVAVPAAVLGPARAADEYRKYAQVFFGPLLNLSEDRSRHEELLGMNATDSMGIKEALHCWLNPDPLARPKDYHPAETCTYVGLGVLMTLAVLWPGRRLRPVSPWPVSHQMALLVVLMVLFSPISHVHYFTFCLPLVMSLLFRRWQCGTTLRTGWLPVLALTWFAAATSLPSLPVLQPIKDLRIPLLGVLPLWGLGVVELWRSGQGKETGAIEPPRLAA